MSERMAGVSFSLLKYDNPVLVRESGSAGNRVSLMFTFGKTSKRWFVQ